MRSPVPPPPPPKGKMKHDCPVNYRKGDTVVCMVATGVSWLRHLRQYLVTKDPYYDDANDGWLVQVDDQSCLRDSVNASRFVLATKFNSLTTKGINMFSKIKNDVSALFLEHKSVIYIVAGIFLLDQLVFKGVFRARLQSIVESLVAKVEAKIKA